MYYEIMCFLLGSVVGLVAGFKLGRRVANRYVLREIDKIIKER